MKFTKKPVTIEAIQWTGANLREVICFTDGPPDVRHDHAAMKWEEYNDLVARDGLKIFTLEGKMNAAVGDWIIKGVKGEHYPCKPDIFEMTYGPAAPERSGKLADEPGWQRGIATVTMSGHQLREALDFIAPSFETDFDELDNDLTFGVVQHEDDNGKPVTGLCCWNEDSDGVLPLAGEPLPVHAPEADSSSAAPSDGYQHDSHSAEHIAAILGRPDLIAAVAALKHELWCAEVNLDGAKEEIAELRLAAPSSTGESLSAPLSSLALELLNHLHGSAPVPDEWPQPYAGIIVLLETFADIGMTAKRDGKPTPNSELCRRFASDLRAALATPRQPEDGSGLSDELSRDVGYESGTLISDPTGLGAEIHLHFVSPAHGEIAFEWITEAIEARILGQQCGGDVARLEEARREGWAQGMQEAQELLASEISDATLLDWLDGEEFVALNCYVAVYDEHGQPLEKERKHYLIERESSIATVEAPTVREAIRAAIQAQAGEGDIRG